MDRFYYLPVTTPSNTPIATPQSTSWPLEDNWLEYVEIVIPPGPSGLVGFRVLWAQQQIVPWANNSYLVADNDKIHVDVNVGIAQTGLVIVTYNLDVFPHTLYFRAQIRNISPADLANVEATTGQLAVPAGLDITDTGTGINTFTAGGFSSTPSEVDLGTLTDEGAADLLNPEIPVETPTGTVGQDVNIPPAQGFNNGGQSVSDRTLTGYEIPEPGEFTLARVGS